MGSVSKIILTAWNSISLLMDVRDEKHVAWLLSSIGPKTYGLLKNLTFLDVVVKLLKEHLNRTPFEKGFDFINVNKNRMKPSMLSRHISDVCVVCATIQY